MSHGTGLSLNKKKQRGLNEDVKIEAKLFYATINGSGNFFYLNTMGSPRLMPPACRFQGFDDIC